MKAKIALFASGQGSNARVLVEAMSAGWIAADPVLLLTDRECGAEQLGTEFHFPVKRIQPKNFTDRALWETAVTEIVEQSGADLVVLCGYLRLIPAALCRLYPELILNIHPGPLPDFGGKGMWGHHVHEAVLQRHVNWSGPTIHFVNEEYDKGDIIAHVPVPVYPGDTAAALGERVLQVEHRLYPLIVAQTVAKCLQQN